MSLFQRSIVHLDADAFFASVEQAADPHLRDKPIAVGGEKRGIIASASYEARKFGIYTPMPTVLARRLCPKLILLPGDFEKYELFSRLMFSYAYDFTPDVEIGSIDEGYFDLTGTRKPALDIAETIRRAIRQGLKLPVSEGIGSNKLISQIASKLKKPCAFEQVPFGGEAQFLAPLQNKWLPGVGPKTASQLNAAGLALIGQVAQTPPDLLHLLVGNLALPLRNFARGIDERPIIPARAPAKSYSEQETFATDTTDEEFLAATLRRMADKLMAKVREDGKSIRTLTVKVRYNDMDEEQAGESLAEPTDLETELYTKVTALLRKAWRRRVSLRLVSLKLSNIYDGRFFGGLALDAAARQHCAQQRLADVVDALRQKHGRSVLLRAHDFILREKAGGNPKSEGRKSKEDRNPKVEIRITPLVNEHTSPILRSRAAAEDGRITYRAFSQPVTSSRPSAFSFVPLNVHSYYSFLNSTLSIQAIVELAKQHELPAVALTDTNNLHGAIEFAQAATATGIKPIIGAELNWNGHRLCLYVQNQTGYRNLCRLLSEESSKAERRNPKEIREPKFEIRDKLLDTHRASRLSPDIVIPDCASSHFDLGPLGFELSDGLLAVSSAAELAPFFPGRFYLAIDSLEAFEKRIRPLPCVASFPIHYALASDRWKYDIVQSIRTLTLLRQAHPEKRLDGEFHFRTAAEMRKLFAAHPELLAHSQEIADRCSFAFALGKPQFPSFSPPDGSSPALFLRRLVMEGLQRRYPQNHARLKPQLEEELAIIMEVGYEEYFLVMWDILQECRRRGIDWITRGSAADSLACYCLEISNVCPLRFDLYFRRFLNKERMALNKLPDIDVDFPHDRKDDVIELIFEKYKPSHTAVVGGFSTFQSRSAFAEVAKVLGVSEYQVRRLTERLPYYTHARELAQAVAGSQECRDLPLDQEPYSTALQMAQFLDGFPRYPKMHPCGLVLSRQPMQEITPCFTSAKGYPTTHFDMDSIEAVGLVKMDILAQGGLAVIRDVLTTLQRPSGFDLPSPQGPFNDPEVWALIASGDARAVHHIESPAMISLCKMCNVRDIDTLIAIVSVIRPGAANESKKMEFARRYQGLSPVRYPHSSLEPCLRSTYGLVVYEEHILQICDAFAGLPPGRADILRRALTKENNALIQQIQSEFADCARRRGRTESEIAEVWELVAGFRGYAFCKAHSTAYGVEAYQSAWLKHYYPAEFMAAVLTNGKGFYSPLVYILECHRLGIPLLPPSINEPGPQFRVAAAEPAATLEVKSSKPESCGEILDVGKPPAGHAPFNLQPAAFHASFRPSFGPRPSGFGLGIRVPVLQIKGLTEHTSEAILKARARGEFTSLTDFFRRVQPLPEEMEILIRSGAFDLFGQTRTGQYWEFRKNAECGVRSIEKHTQFWLFPPLDNLPALPAIPLSEPTHLERLRAEEELLGYPVSGHPLELFPAIAWDTYCPVARLGGYLGKQIVTCGLVIEQRLFHQVTGEPMKFLTIADWTGVIETELFARTYQSYGLNTIRYRVLEITATVEPFENGRGYTLRVLQTGKPRQGTQANFNTSH